MPSRGVIQFLLSLVMGKQLYLTGNNDNTTINNNNHHHHHCHNSKNIFKKINYTYCMSVSHYIWDKPSVMQLFSGFVQGTWMSTWTSSLTQKPPTRQWFRLVLPFSSTFIIDQILHLEEIRYNMFSRKAVAGVIKPETLPPTKGAVAQHALRAYLQTWDWILCRACLWSPVTMDGH